MIRSYAKKIGQEGEDLDTNVQDILADLMHLSYQEGLDWNRMLDMAEFHFESEKDEDDLEEEEED